MTKNAQPQTPEAARAKAAKTYEHTFYNALGEIYGLADLVTITHPDPKHTAALTASELNRLAAGLADLKATIGRLANPLHEQAQNMPEGFIE